MISSRSRSAGGIRATSFAVVMKRTSDEVERQFDETVLEVGVLLRVEHLEQHGGRRGAELVDLVEHEDGVVASHPPHLAQDRAGLRVSPGAVVAPQVRRVVQPAAGQLHESPPERAGGALGQRGLAHAGRAREADHGARAARVPPPHGQVLEDARLGVPEAGVPGIERRAHAPQVDRRRAAASPRQLLEPLDPVVGRLGVAVRLVRHAPPLARDGGAHGLGQCVDGSPSPSTSRTTAGVTTSGPASAGRRRFIACRQSSASFAVSCVTPASSVWSRIARRIASVSKRTVPSDAAVRHASSGGNGGPADNASNSLSDDTSHSAITAGPSETVSGATTGDDAAGSGPRRPADIGTVISNGRFNTYCSAMCTFSCSV